MEENGMEENTDRMSKIKETNKRGSRHKSWTWVLESPGRLSGHSTPILTPIE